MCLSTCACVALEGCGCEKKVPEGKVLPFVPGTGTFSNYFTFLGDSAPFFSRAPAIATPFHTSSHSFVFFIPASVSTLSSVFFLCHFIASPHPRHVIAPSGCLPPRSLFQEVPTALRVHRVPDRNEDGFYCTMTNSKHFFFLPRSK